jgi:hypothetical protein
MGGGRIPGPICTERLGEDPIGRRGFSDPIPLGSGSGGGVVTLTGWPRSISWDEFSEVAAAPGGAAEAAQIHSEAVQPEQVEVDRDNGRFRVSAYTVRVEVVADDSWVVKSQKSSALLAHEQGHYDITGLTARDMVAQIAAVRAASPQDLQTQVTAIIERTKTLGKRLTDLYDGDGSTGTHHGKHAANQARWEAHLRDHRDKNLRLTDGPKP